MRNRSGRVGPVILAVAVLACGGGEAAEAGGTGGRGGAGGGMGDPADRVVPVEVAEVVEGSISRSITVSGVVEPIRSVGVTSQLSGTLLTVTAEEGDVVRRGAPLARIDDRELRAQLAAAEAAHEVAEASYRRAEQLRERRVITLPEYERERTALASARAQLDQVRTRLAYAAVGAPIHGVVTEKRVEAGDLVSPQTRMFTLADVSTMVVRVGVSELDVVHLEVGDAATVALDALRNRTLRGTIRRIFPSADPGTRLVPVEVALDEPDARLARPGFLARVSFALGATDGVLLVPASALVGGSGAQSVFVVEDGQAARRTVTTGMSSEGRMEVVSGLFPGQQVVVRGNNMLRDGMSVRVVNPQPAAGAGEG